MYVIASNFDMTNKPCFIPAERAWFQDVLRRFWHYFQRAKAGAGSGFLPMRNFAGPAFFVPDRRAQAVAKVVNAQRAFPARFRSVTLKNRFQCRSPFFPILQVLFQRVEVKPFPYIPVQKTP